MAITIKKSTLTLKKQEPDPISVEGAPQTSSGPVLSTAPASSWTVYAIAGLIGVLFMAALIFIQFLEHSHYKNAFLDPQVAAAAAAAQAAAAPAAAKPAAEAPAATNVEAVAATSAPDAEAPAPDAEAPAPAAEKSEPAAATDATSEPAAATDATSEPAPDAATDAAPDAEEPAS